MELRERGKDRPGKDREPWVMGVSLACPALTNPVMEVGPLTNPVMEVGLCSVARDLAEFVILAGKAEIPRRITASHDTQGRPFCTGFH
jgi:hypothetical protein